MEDKWQGIINKLLDDIKTELGKSEGGYAPELINTLSVFVRTLCDYKASKDC